MKAILIEQNAFEEMHKIKIRLVSETIGRIWILGHPGEILSFTLSKTLSVTQYISITFLYSYNYRIQIEILKCGFSMFKNHSMSILKNHIL